MTALDALGDGGVDAVEVIRRNVGASQREARRRQRRAEALAEMPNVADALAGGDISTEHAEALARAASATSPEAVDGDGELLTQVAGVPADVVSGADPQGRCEIPGVGPIPQSELERLACDAELFGLLFSGDGEPLWHGRGERTATDAQWQALLARDGVCVLCADEPSRCEAHHVVPWAKPGEGPTDIDNLALLCGTCHRRLHHLAADLQALDGWTS